MAQADANEQIKEVLRQLIKHRFWIAVGFAALFAVIAYFMGSGPVNAQAAKEIADIKKAESGVKAYAVLSKPTDKYKPIVVEKTEIMGKDVNKAWKELYDRQAPLLTWPDTVANRIPKWGPKWPENEDAGMVKLAIVDYIYAYPAYVDMVFKTFDPFDYETGKGIVATPSKEALLRPQQFNIEKVPTLGTVWAAQQRLWIQRTMLEVIREVNKKAKATDWDTAIVKEINVLEVGNPDAQDQRSLAENLELKQAPDILSPEQQKAADAESAGSGAGGGMGGGAGGQAGAMAARMKMMGGGGSGGGMAAKEEDGIYYITPSDDKGQYKIMPVSMTVLIDQDHVQDLLVELENSPMSVRVMDFELQRPATQVEKPEKGEARGGMMGMMGFGMMGGRERGFGGMAARMEAMRGMMGPMRGGMGRMPRPGMNAMMPGMGGKSTRDDRKKVALDDRKKARTEAEKEIEKRKGPSLVDPYFTIVQVIVYGQARFYNAPPAEAEAPASPGDVAATPAAPGAPGAIPPAGSATPSAAGATPPAGGAAPTTTTAPAPGATAPAPAPAPSGAPAPAQKPAEAAKPAAPAPASPAAGAPSAKAEADTAGAPGKAAAEKPADAKPAAPAAGSARPDTPAATPKK